MHSGLAFDSYAAAMSLVSVLADAVLSGAGPVGPRPGHRDQPRLRAAGRGRVRWTSTTVSSYRPATGRSDLTLAPGERLLGGGTWLFSEPQPGTTGLVDLTTLGWPSYERLPAGGLRIAATCTVAELVALPWDELAGPGAGAGALARTCADALLMSFKIQAAATVGGNLCLALPAGAMLALTAALAGEVVVWTPDGGERRAAGHRLRHRRPDHHAGSRGGAARGRPARLRRCGPGPRGRRMALTPHGRSSALVLGRADAAGDHPDRDRGDHPAGARSVVPHGAGQSALEAALAGIDCWYEDAHGAADWRRSVTGLLAAEVLAELAEPAPGTPAGRREGTR